MMKWFGKQRRETHVRTVLSRPAAIYLSSSDFANAPPFFRAFGKTLAPAVIEHVVGLVCQPIAKDDDPSLSGSTVIEQWHKASDDNFKDLATLLAWRYSKVAFNDVAELFDTEYHEDSCDTLMMMAGKLFPATPRALQLCTQYQDCLNGDYLKLGGGLLVEGGTYGVSPGSPELATHFWMINEALSGPALNVLNGPLTPASAFFLKSWTCGLLIRMIDMYRKESRLLYGN